MSDYHENVKTGNTLSKSAESSTLRVKSPGTSIELTSGISPCLDRRPYVGLRPTRPQNDAGLRVEPPVSEPNALHTTLQQHTWVSSVYDLVAREWRTSKMIFQDNFPSMDKATDAAHNWPPWRGGWWLCTVVRIKWQNIHRILMYSKSVIPVEERRFYKLDNCDGVGMSFTWMTHACRSSRFMDSYFMAPGVGVCTSDRTDWRYKILKHNVSMSWRQNMTCKNLGHHLPATFSVRSANGCVVHPLRAWIETKGQGDFAKAARMHDTQSSHMTDKRHCDHR